jgi:hypothetical protein
MQKLESDIRGHIRLEHEMKIHMDYLEGKIEKYEKEHILNLSIKLNFEKNIGSL